MESLFPRINHESQHSNLSQSQSTRNKVDDYLCQYSAVIQNT